MKDGQKKYNDDMYEINIFMKGVLQTCSIVWSGANEIPSMGLHDVKFYEHAELANFSSHYSQNSHDISMQS